MVGTLTCRFSTVNSTEHRTELRSGESRTGRFLEDSDPFDGAEYLVMIIILMSLGSARERYPVRSVDATRRFSHSYSFHTTDGIAWFTQDDLIECIYKLRTILPISRRLSVEKSVFKRQPLSLALHRAGPSTLR